MLWVLCPARSFPLCQEKNIVGRFFELWCCCLMTRLEGTGWNAPFQRTEQCWTGGVTSVAIFTKENVHSLFSSRPRMSKGKYFDLLQPDYSFVRWLFACMRLIIIVCYRHIRVIWDEISVHLEWFQLPNRILSSFAEENSPWSFPVIRSYC